MDDIDPYFSDMPAPDQKVAGRKEDIDPYFSDVSRPTTKATGYLPESVNELQRATSRGLTKLAVSLPGLPGDIESLADMGLNWLRKKGYIAPGKTYTPYLPTSEKFVEAAKPYLPILREKTPEGLPRYAELLAGTVPLAGKAAFRYGVAPATAMFGAEKGVQSGALPEWAPLAAGVFGAAVPSVGMAALSRRLSPAERMIQGATKGMTERDVNEMERMFEESRDINAPVLRSEAGQQVTGGATGLGDLQRVAEGLGALKPFFAQRAGQVERAGRDYLDQITPANMEPSGIGLRTQEAARSIIGETPEGQRLEQNIWAAGPRTTAEQAGEVIQPELSKILERREGMRNALATPAYEAARNAPASIPLDGGFGFREVTKHYDPWPTIRDETGKIRPLTEAEIAAEQSGLQNLRGEVSDIRREAKPLTEQERTSLEKKDVEDVFGPDKMAAEIAIGARKLAPPPSLLNWMAREGGIFDARGDVASILGGKKVPGLLRTSRDSLGQTGGRGLDDWAEKLYNDYPEHFPEGRPSPNDVLSMVADADRGHPPAWWVGEDRLALERNAENYRDLFDQLGVQPKTLSEAAAALKGGDPSVMKRLYEKHLAAADLPGAESSLAAREGRVKDILEGTKGGVNITEKMPIIGLSPTKFGQVNVSNVANVLDSMLETAKGGIKTSLQAARKTLNTPSGELDASVAGIHNAREALNDLMDEAKRTGNNKAAVQLLATKNALDKSLESVPEYAKAVETYKAASEPLKPFEQPSIEKVTNIDQYGKEFELPPEQVASTIEKGGASAAEAFSKIASPEARNAYLNRLATQVLDEAGGAKAGIDLDASKIRQYMTKHEDELRRFPELNDRLTQIANARDDIERLKVTPIGKLLGKKEVGDAVNSLFPQMPSPNSEREIGQALSKLAEKDQKVARDLVRYHIERTFNNATRSLQGGPAQFGGATFAAKIAGDSQARKNILAAVKAVSGNDVAKGFERFLDIMGATGQRQRIGSQTSFNNELNLLMKEGNTPEEAAKIIFGFGTKFPTKVKEKWDRWRMGKNAEEIGQILMDPKHADTFRRIALRQKNPLITQNLVNRLLLASTGSKQSQVGREERASGGRVNVRDYPAKKATRLEREARRAHRDMSEELRPMMHMPDEAIAHALRLAK